MNRDPVLYQGVDELGGRGKVGLVGGQDVTPGIPLCRVAQNLLEVARVGSAEALLPLITCVRFARHRGPDGIYALGMDRPVVTASPLDRVSSHQVDVVQQSFAISRSIIENRTVGGDRVVDGLAEVPTLRRDGEWEVVAGKLPLGHELDLDRRGIPLGLREKPDHVVEVSDRSETAVPPGGVARPRPHRRPRLPLGHESAVHGGAHHLDSQDDQRVEVVVEWVAERWRKHDGTGRPSLMVVVHDLGKPFMEHDARHVLGFLLARQEEIAVVVVADVLVVQPRDTGRGSLGRLRLPHVPVRHQLHAVGVGV